VKPLDEAKRTKRDIVLIASWEHRTDAVHELAVASAL